MGGISAGADNGGEAVGGGLYLSNSGTAAVVLNDDTITGNQVVGGTGGAGATGGLSWGAALPSILATALPERPWRSPIPRSPTTSYKAAPADPEQRAATPTVALPIFFTGGSQLQNDTIYGNSVIGGAGTTAGNAVGGGIVDDTGTDTIQGLSLLNVTVAFNTAQGGTAYGGGLNNDSGDASLAVSNSLIAENTANFGPDVSGAAATTDHNLIGIYDNTVASGFSSLDGDQLGTSGSPINPLLGPLQNNGGNTQTVALLPGSPAINAGDTTAAAGLSTDQRGTGFTRVVNGTVDVGAYEVQASLATTTTLSPISSPVNVGQSVTFSATVSAGSGTPTGSVTFEDTISGVTTTLGTAALSSGVATFQAQSLPAGSNSVTAVYSGAATFNGSSSASQVVVANVVSGTAYAPSATAADGTASSLRTAIAQANAAAGASTIVLSSGSYSLTQGQLNYSNTAGTLTIIGQGSTGPNATVIDQLSLDRVLNVAAGATVILENVEITGGLAVTDQGGGTGEADGGGILTNGSLSLSNTIVAGNKADCDRARRTPPAAVSMPPRPAA